MLRTTLISNLAVSQNGTVITLAALVGFLAVNVLSFGHFYLDKHRAANMKQRIPEGRLLLLSALGPFGAWIGMNAFRHKTRKLKFKLVPLFAAVHLFLAVLMFF